jgi:hypothetical protein
VTSEERAAANEATARNVNEAIERGQWPGEQDARQAFRCECSSSQCNQLLDVTPRSYEEVRRNPRRFLMVPGHECDDIEFVVERTERYLVVEKRDHAAEVAEATDPRS